MTKADVLKDLGETLDFAKEIFDENSCEYIDTLLAARDLIFARISNFRKYKIKNFANR